jgi:hypothetical protein
MRGLATRQMASAPDQGPAQEIRFPVVKPLLGGPAAAFVMVLNLGRDAAPMGRLRQVNLAGGLAQVFQGLGLD